MTAATSTSFVPPTVAEPRRRAHAVRRAADEPILAGAERDHAVRIARHQRDDPPRHVAEGQRATEVVDDAKDRRSASYITRAKVAAWRRPLPRLAEDPLVAKAFGGASPDEFARAVAELSPEEAEFFLKKLELALRKRKIMLSGYIIAMVAWVVGMVCALAYFGLASGFVGWVFLVPFAIVGVILAGDSASGRTRSARPPRHRDEEVGASALSSPHEADRPGPRHARGMWQ